MTRLCLVALVMCATSVFATDSVSGRVAAKIAPRIENRPNRYLQAAVEAERRERDRIASLVELLSATRPKLEVFILRQYEEGALDRAINELLNEMSRERRKIRANPVPMND